MERRKFLIGIGATSVGGGAVLGSGAFSRVESDRYMAIEVAEDPDAYLGLNACDSPHGDQYVDIDDDGHLYVDLGENANGGEGVNSNSRTWFDDLVQLCNQGTDDAYVWIERGDDWPTVDDGEFEDEPRVDFYLGDAGDFLLGEDNAQEVEIGECHCIGIKTNTHGIDATDDETLLEELDDVVTLVADVEPPDTPVPGASFEVSDLDPTDIPVESGGTFDLSATITNSGDGEATQELELRVDDTVFETREVTLSPDDEETISFEDIELNSLDPGEYTYGVFSDDDSQPGTLTIEDEAGPDRPNIVFIMADDMGYGDTSVDPFTSDLDISTPNLEEMAANGARFANHHSGAAKCTPTRAALMTGSYAPRTSVTDVHVFFPDHERGLHPDDTTVAEVLREQGYATGVFGKWHLGHEDPFLPQNQGFDTYFGVPYSNDMSPLPLLDGFETIEQEAPNGSLTQLYTERATQFIEDHQDEPFFLYLPHSMPHLPLGVSEEFEGSTGEGLFANVIRELDWSVGQILNTIEELEVDDETIVVFTSDDGPWVDRDEDLVGSAGPFRGGKNYTHEGGSRVPTIMQWKDEIPDGAVCDELTSHLDLLPTVVNLTGASLPEHTIDGRNITEMLLDPETTSSSYEYYYYYDGSNLEAIQEVETSYKYHFVDEALYDLKEDPGEQTDLSDESPGVVETLMEQAEEFDSGLQGNARELGDLSSIAYASIESDSNAEIVAANFLNNSDTMVENVDLTLFDPDNEWSLEPDSATSIDTVESDSSVTVEWQIDATPEDLEDGIYLEVEATYETPSHEDSTSAGEVVSYRAPLDPLPEEYSTFNNGSDEPVFGADGETVIVEGTGVPVEGDGTDEYTAVYLDDALPPEGRVLARIDSVEQVAAYSTADLVVRNDLTLPGESPGYASVPINDEIAELKVDGNSNGFFASDEISSWDSPGLPVWVRIERDGTTYEASYSTDGAEWAQIDTFELEEASEFQDVGVALSGPNETNHRAEIGELRVETGLEPLPARYSTFNNGSDEPVFGADGETVIVEGRGIPLEGDGTDEYTAVYLDDALPSEGTALARIDSVDQVSNFSTADLVVRNDLTRPGESPGYASLPVNDEIAELKVDGNSNGFFASEEVTEWNTPGLPVWVRIERNGTAYTASYSNDGTEWAQIDTFELDEASEFQDVGIALSGPNETNHRAEIGEFEVTTEPAE